MKLDFDKYTDGLIPAVVQDARTQKVLMVGFMNQKALKKTKKIGKATFYSRSQKKIWTKGETSGNFLKVKDILIDCDKDTILIKAYPKGKICHKGTATCFKEKNKPEMFLHELEAIIEDRKNNPKRVLIHHVCLPEVLTISPKNLVKNRSNLLSKQKIQMTNYSKPKPPMCFISLWFYLLKEE